MKMLFLILLVSAVLGVVLSIRYIQDCFVQYADKNSTLKRRYKSISALVSTTTQKSVKVGLSGAKAGVVQVIVLMWLRTATNYQYVHGVSLTEALTALYREGGVFRLYRGLPFALVQGPLAKFGAVYANEWAQLISLAIIRSNNSPQYANMVRSAAGGLLAALWRVALMPIDTCKTVLQVQGWPGLVHLWMEGRISGFYEGSVATLANTLVSHYPFFFVFNLLDAHLNVPSSILGEICRNAVIGFLASASTDLVANPIRVVKTMKQSHVFGSDLSYFDAFSSVVQKDGVWGLFGRGLLGRIVCNGIQSIFFVVLWKYFMKLRERQEKPAVSVPTLEEL